MIEQTETTVTLDEPHERYISRFNWTPGITLEQIEKEAVLAAFEFYRHNKTVTAQALGIAIRTLDAKLKDYQVQRKDRKTLHDERKAEAEYWLKRSRGIDCDPPPSVIAKKAMEEKIARARQGYGLEPTSDDRAEQSLPLPKRKEVQDVLPQASAARGQPGKR